MIEVMTFEIRHILISSQSLYVLDLHDLTVLMISFSTTGLKNRELILRVPKLILRVSTVGGALARLGPMVEKNVLNSFAMVNLSDISSPLHSNCFGKSFGHFSY